MSKLKLLLNFTLTALLIALSVSLVSAQGKDKDKDKGKDQAAVQDPTDKPRNVKVELKQAYKRWLDNDVAYIITKDEKRAFMVWLGDREFGK